MNKREVLGNKLFAPIHLLADQNKGSAVTLRDLAME
jgi:hypothetical protein